VVIMDAPFSTARDELEEYLTRESRTIQGTFLQLSGLRLLALFLYG